MESTRRDLGTGAWAHDDLRKTSSSEVGVGADANLPDETRFVAGVAKLLRKRHTVSPPSNDTQNPALFLLAPTAFPNDLAIPPKRVPRLQAGLEVLTGRLWFTQPTVVTGRYIDIVSQDTDELFRYVTDVLGLGSVPAAFYDPKETPTTLAFYSQGLENEENVEELTLEQSAITLDMVFNVIDHIYHRNLITPEAQSKVGQLWANRDKFWPTSQAEDTVQHYLQIGLTVAFPSCTVRVEQTQTSGRLDLEIEESDFHDPSSVVRHVLLELKVLRSFLSTGVPVSATETLDWVYKGMEQAASYRDERGTRYSALCCFDMRKDNTGNDCFNHVITEANKLSVVLRRWYLHSTSAAHRTAHVNQQLNKA